MMKFGQVNKHLETKNQNVTAFVERLEL